MVVHFYWVAIAMPPFIWVINRSIAAPEAGSVAALNVIVAAASGSVMTIPRVIIKVDTVLPPLLEFPVVWFCIHAGPPQFANTIVGAVQAVAAPTQMMSILY